MRYFAAVMCFFSLVCCVPPEDAVEQCGELNTELPDLESGAASYVRDGQRVNVASGGGYKLDFPNDIVINALIINMKQDEERRLVKDLVKTGKFPICVPLDSQDDGSGWASIEDGGVSYSTNEEHGGFLVIQKQDGDALVGRFAFEALQNMGTAVTKVEDGAFFIGSR